MCNDDADTVLLVNKIELFLNFLIKLKRGTCNPKNSLIRLACDTTSAMPRSISVTYQDFSKIRYTIRMSIVKSNLRSIVWHRWWCHARNPFGFSHFKSFFPPGFLEKPRTQNWTSGPPQLAFTRRPSAVRRLCSRCDSPLSSGPYGLLRGNLTFPIDIFDSSALAIRCRMSKFSGQTFQGDCLRTDGYLRIFPFGPNSTGSNGFLRTM